MPTVYLKTYGCQMNVRDSEQVTRDLLARGYILTDDATTADVVLLNTCSVRDMAEQKAISKMRSTAGRRRKDSSILGFLGCMAQSRADELTHDVPGVNLVVGTQKFHRTAEYVDELLASRALGGDESDLQNFRTRIVDVAEEAGSQNSIRDHDLAPRQVTAFVSIMQGCNMHCTFCIVPSTRGAERSRPLQEIVREVEELADCGVKEVTLLGQIVNLYGRHEFASVDGRSPFAQLLRAVCAVKGIERVRFTSPHPIGFRQDIISCFADLPNLCQHVHLPVQSGSDAMLKRMHRGYTRQKYMNLVNNLRTARPDITFTTDIIVGFPGESDADFQETASLVREVNYDNAFIFRYSPRRDTPAATMPDQIAEEVKMERNQQLLTILDELAAERIAQTIGTEVEILVEGESRTSAARYQGRTRTNRLVLIEANERWLGQLLPVKLVECTGFTYYAEPVLVG